MKRKTVRVFNIERFATDDGDGIRTVVFLKGCDLRCKWCANPESQSFKKQVLFHPNLCTACGICLDRCPYGAVELLDKYGYISNTSLCVACGKCVEECFNNARSLLGEDYTVRELLAELLRDKDYYKVSNGGVTFSGGEPLHYSKFIRDCALELKKEDINTLVETCGYIARENLEDITGSVDYIYYDIKHMDSVKHVELTGKGNELILENLQWLTENFKGRISVRYPYISFCNEDKESIDKFMHYVSRLKNIYEIVFLPYHRLGLPKYSGLGRCYPMRNLRSLKKSEIEYLLKEYEDYNLDIKIQ